MQPIPFMKIKRAFLKSLFASTIENKPRQPLYLFHVVRKNYLREANITLAEPVRQIVLFELSRDGYIKLWDDGSYVLTQKGLAISRKPIEQMLLPLTDIFPQIIANIRLSNIVHNDYMEGDFESVVLKAFKLLEESVRAKAELTENDYGMDLMEKAFKPNVGCLVYPDAKTPGEQDSLRLLMKGAIGFYKNPKSHRTIEIDDPNKVINMVLFAKLLLDVVEQCNLRKPSESARR